MPKGDRTGPLGEGPLTGRQLGYGAGYNSPGYTNFHGTGPTGRGFWNRTTGFGRGFGRRFLPGDRYRGKNQVYFGRPDTFPAREENEIKRVQTEVSDLKERLNALMARMESLTSRKNDDQVK